jgi:hypothetical protein
MKTLATTLLLCFVYVISVGPNGDATSEFLFSTRAKAQTFAKQALTANNVSGVKLECKE